MGLIFGLIKGNQWQISPLNSYLISGWGGGYGLTLRGKGRSTRSAWQTIGIASPILKAEEEMSKTAREVELRLQSTGEAPVSVGGNGGLRILGWSRCICAIGSINSHCFPMVGDGKNQPNSRGLHTHYKDSY